MPRAQSPTRLDLDDLRFPCDRYGYVYLVTFRRPTDGKLFYYVGQHRGTRLSKTYTGSGFILRRYINKYGTEGNLHLKILHWAFSKDELDFNEILLIVFAKEVFKRDCLNVMYGGVDAVFSNETRALIGSYHIGKTLTASHREAISRAQLGKPKSKETKRKMSAYLYANPRVTNMTEAHRAAFTMAGKTHSEATKRKMSAAAKGRPKPESTCPTCGKVGRSGVMQRWHFDNCRVQ